MSGAAAGIGAGDVEIAKRGIAEIVRGGGVAQHPLRHQLGTAIRVDRIGVFVLRHGHAFRRAIDGGRGGEHEIAHTLGDTGFDQVAGRDRVVGVIGEGVFDRFRNHDRTGKVHHRVDGHILDKVADLVLVPGVALNECGIFGDQSANAGRKVVQYDRVLSPVQQRINHVAADVPGAACHKYAHAEPCR